MLITIYIRSICRVWPVIWIVAVHKWNTKTNMQLLSLFCHINSPDISMHMNKNFNALLKAGSLIISFFLMDRPRPPSICSFDHEAEKKESMKPVTHLDNFSWFWLSGGRLVWPCSSGLLNPLGCAVNKFRKSWGLWTFLIAILSIHAASKTWKRIADMAFQWTPFPKSELCLRWIPISSPASRSRNWRDASHFEAAVRRPFRQLSFLKSACMSGLTCHECAKGIWKRAALPSCGWEANETAKLLTTLARFQGLTSIRVPSRSPATKKWTDSCSSTPLFLELPIFSTWNIRAVLKTLQKVWSYSCVCNTNQSKAISRSRSIPTLTSGIFTCGEKLHQSTNLPTFHCICGERLLHAVGPGKRMDFRPTHHGVTSGPQAVKSTRNFLFCFRFFCQSHARAGRETKNLLGVA